MTELIDIPWTSDGGLEVLKFYLQDELFALEADLVREIVEEIPETIVPGAPALVGSLANFRGRIVPLVDLRFAFEMATAAPIKDPHIVVVELDLDGEASLIGLRTGRVAEVSALTRADSEPPPMVGLKWRRNLVRRLFRSGDDVIVLPDL